MTHVDPEEHAVLVRKCQEYAQQVERLAAAIELMRKENQALRAISGAK